MQKDITFEFALGSATLSLDIEDTRPDFDLTMFNWILMDIQDVIIRDCLRLLAGADDFLPGDGMSRHDVKRGKTSDTTRIRLKIDVTYHHPHAETRMHELMEIVIEHLLASIRHTLDAELNPKPDVEAFLKELEALHQSDGHPTNERVLELARKHNMRDVHLFGSADSSIPWVGGEESDAPFVAMSIGVAPELAHLLGRRAPLFGFRVRG
ncbi:MAG: hypothetical protein JWM37_103 [Candidatus Saccharibacteria bacterium]|nr:hypothetical protein [Candidatus Saccharibacteria bacterium]